MVPPPSRGRGVGRVPALLALLAVSCVLVVVVVVVVSTSTGTSRSEVRAGWPLTWVVQDQSALSPPAGARSPGRLLGPWEHPTTVDGGPLAVDVAVVAAALLVVTGTTASLRRRRRSGR